MLHKLVHRPIVPAVNPPLLVLMHGLGVDEHDLMGLVPELDPRLMVVSLRAPHEYEFGGFAWFDVTWDADGVHVDATAAVESRRLVLDALAELPRELGVESSKVFVGGFSQGAMMALGVSLCVPEKLAGVMVLSGRLLPAFVPPEPPMAFAQLPFLVQHGSLDPLLPVQSAREIRAFLEANGCPLTYREYPMAHEISQASLSDAAAWLVNLIE